MGAAGIDVEAAEHVEDDAVLVDAIRTPEKRDPYLATPVDERSSFLLRYWTANESFLKASLVGLGRAPRPFTVGPPTDVRHEVYIDGTLWSFRRIDAGAVTRRRWTTHHRRGRDRPLVE